jgi:hypothetical protein
LCPNGLRFFSSVLDFISLENKNCLFSKHHKLKFAVFHLLKEGIGVYKTLQDIITSSIGKIVSVEA